MRVFPLLHPQMKTSPALQVLPLRGGGLSRSVTVNQEEGDRLLSWFKRNTLIDDLSGLKYSLFLPNFFDFPPSMSSNGVNIDTIYEWHNQNFIPETSLGTPGEMDYFDFKSKQFQRNIILPMAFEFTVHDVVDKKVKTNAMFVHRNSQPLTANSDYFSIQGPTGFTYLVWINGTLCTFTSAGGFPYIKEWADAVEKMQSLGWDISDTENPSGDGTNLKFVIKKISSTAESVFIEIIQSTISTMDAFGYVTVVR